MFSSNTRLSYKDAPEGCHFTPGDKLSIAFSHSHGAPNDHIPQLPKPRRSISRLRTPTNVFHYISENDGSDASSNRSTVDSSHHLQLLLSSSVTAKPGDKYHVSLQQSANVNHNTVAAHTLPLSLDNSCPFLFPSSDTARGCTGSIEDINGISRRLRHPLARSPHTATSLSSPPVAPTIFPSRIPRPRRGSTGSLSVTLTPTRALTGSLSITLTHTSTNNSSSLVPSAQSMRVQQSDPAMTTSPRRATRESPRTTPRSLPARSTHQERLNASMATEIPCVHTPSRTHLQLLRTPVRFTVVQVAPAIPARTDGADDPDVDGLETTPENTVCDAYDEATGSRLTEHPPAPVEGHVASETTAPVSAASPQRTATRARAERRGKFAYEPASLPVGSMYRDAGARLHVAGWGAVDDEASAVEGKPASLGESAMLTPEECGEAEDAAPVLSVTMSVRSEGGLWGAVDGLVLHGDLCLSFDTANDASSPRRPRCVSSSPSARGQPRTPSPHTPATPGRRQRSQASHSCSPALSRASSTRPHAPPSHQRTPTRTTTSTTHAHTPRTPSRTPSRTHASHRASSGSSQRRTNTPTALSSTAWPFSAYMQATTTFSARSAGTVRTPDPSATLLFRANMRGMPRSQRIAVSSNALAARTAPSALPRVATIVTRNTRGHTDAITTPATPPPTVPRPRARVRPRSPSLQPTPSPARARVPGHARAEADLFKTPRRASTSRVRHRTPHATAPAEAPPTTSSPVSPVFRTPAKATSRAAVFARLRARHSRFEDTHACTALPRPVGPAAGAMDTSSPVAHVRLAPDHLPRDTPRPPKKRFRVCAVSRSSSPQVGVVVCADPSLMSIITPVTVPASPPTPTSIAAVVLPPAPVSLHSPPVELPADPFLAAFARAGVSAALLVAASAPTVPPASTLPHVAAQAYDDALPALPTPALGVPPRRLRPSAVELGGGLTQAWTSEAEDPYVYDECAADGLLSASCDDDGGKASLLLSPVSLSLLQQTPWAGAGALLSPVRERREEEELVRRNLSFEAAAVGVATVAALGEGSSAEDSPETSLREIVSTPATSPEVDAEDCITPPSLATDATGCVDTTAVNSAAAFADTRGNVDEGACEDTGREVQLAVICATRNACDALPLLVAEDGVAMDLVGAGPQDTCDGIDGGADWNSGGATVAHDASSACLNSALCDTAACNALAATDDSAAPVLSAGVAASLAVDADPFLPSHTTPGAQTVYNGAGADLNVSPALDSSPVCVSAEVCVAARADSDVMFASAPPDSPYAADSPAGACAADARMYYDVCDASVTARVDDGDLSAAIDVQCALTDVSTASVKAWPEERAGALSVSLCEVSDVGEGAYSEAAGEFSQLVDSAAATEASMSAIVDASVEEIIGGIAAHVSVVFADDAAEDSVDNMGARCCSCTASHGASDCALPRDGSEYGFGCGHAVGDVHSLSVCASACPAPAQPLSPTSSSRPVAPTATPTSPASAAFSLSATRVHSHLPRAGVAALLGLRAALVSAHKACPMRSRLGKRVRRQEVFTQFRIDYERARALLRGTPVAEAPVETPEFFSQRLDSSASSVEEADGEEMCTERERAALYGLEELHTPSVSLDFAASDEARSGSESSVSASTNMVNARAQCPLSTSLCMLPSQRVREQASCWTSPAEGVLGDVSVPDASEADVGLDQSVFCVDTAGASACVVAEGMSLWNERDVSVCVSGWSDGDMWMRIARSEGDARPSDDDDGDGGDCDHSAATSARGPTTAATAVDAGGGDNTDAGSCGAAISLTAGLDADTTHTPVPRECSIPLPSNALEAPLLSVIADSSCSSDDAEGDLANDIRLTVVDSPACSTTSFETSPSSPIDETSALPVVCGEVSPAPHALSSPSLVHEAPVPVALAAPTPPIGTEMPLTCASPTCTSHPHSKCYLPSSPSTPSTPTHDAYLTNLPPPSIPVSSSTDSPFASPTAPLTDDSFTFMTPARPPRSPSGILTSALSSPRTPNRVTFKSATPSPVHAHAALPAPPPAPACVPLATDVDAEDVQPSEAYWSAYASPTHSQRSFSSLSCWSSTASSVFAEVRYYYPESSDSDSDESSLGVHALELSHSLPLTGPAKELPAAHTDPADRDAFSAACADVCDSAPVGVAGVPAFLAAHSASLQLSYAQVPHYEDDDSHSLCSLSSAASVSCLSDLFSDDADSLPSAPVVSPLQRLSITSPTLLTRTPTPACGLQAAPASTTSPLSGGGTLRRDLHSSTDPSIALPVSFPSAWTSTAGSLSPVLSPVVPPTTPARTSVPPSGALHAESPMFGASPSCHSLSSAFSVSDIDALFSSDDEAPPMLPRPRAPQLACPTAPPSTPNAHAHPLSGASPAAPHRRSFIPLPSVPVIFEETPPSTPAVTLPVVSFRAASPAFSCAATPADVDATSRVMPLALAPPGDHPLTRLSTRARASLSPHIAHRAQQRNPTVFSLVLPLPREEARASPSPSPSVSPPHGSSSPRSVADAAASLLREGAASEATIISAKPQACIVGRSSQRRALPLRAPVFAPCVQVTAIEVEVSGAIADTDEAPPRPSASVSAPVEAPVAALVEVSVAVPAGALPRASPYTCSLTAAEEPNIEIESVISLVQPRRASLGARLLTLVRGQLRALLGPLVTSGAAAVFLRTFIAVVRSDANTLPPLLARVTARVSPFIIAALTSPRLAAVRAYVQHLLAPVNALVLHATHSLPIPRWLRSQQCLRSLQSAQQLLYALMWMLTAHRCCDALSEWMHAD